MTVSIVQQAHGSGTSSGTITLPVNPTPGNAIVVVVGTNVRSTSSVHISITASNWYTSSSIFANTDWAWIGLESGIKGTYATAKASITTNTITYTSSGAVLTFWSVYELDSDAVANTSIRVGSVGATSLTGMASIDKLQYRPNLDTGLASGVATYRPSLALVVLDDAQPDSSGYDAVVMAKDGTPTGGVLTARNDVSYTGPDVARWRGALWEVDLSGCTDSDLYLMENYRFDGAGSDQHSGGAGLFIIYEIGVNEVTYGTDTGGGTSTTLDTEVHDEGLAESTFGVTFPSSDAYSTPGGLGSVALYAAGGFAGGDPGLVCNDGWEILSEEVFTRTTTGEGFAIYVVGKLGRIEPGRDNYEVTFSTNQAVDWSAIVRLMTSFTPVKPASPAYGDTWYSAFADRYLGDKNRSYQHESKLSAAISSGTLSDIGGGHNSGTLTYQQFEMAEVDDKDTGYGVYPRVVIHSGGWAMSAFIFDGDDNEGTSASGWSLSGNTVEQQAQTFAGGNATHVNLLGYKSASMSNPHYSAPKDVHVAAYWLGRRYHNVVGQAYAMAPYFVNYQTGKEKPSRVNVRPRRFRAHHLPHDIRRIR